MILSQCTIVFCRISSFNILIPNSLLDFILYYILELINISTHVALPTMNYMVRTLLFSLQYIRYLYVNVFIYACFWYLLLLKYIIMLVCTKIILGSSIGIVQAICETQVTD